MAGPVTGQERLQLFESAVVPYLDAAYNLARWLTRDRHDAEDLVQESMLRALTYFDGFCGTDGRAWLLAIVRNAFYTRVKRGRGRVTTVPLDEETLGDDRLPDTETVLFQRLEVADLGKAIEGLPAVFREVVVLREIEGLPYREIAEVAGIPIGTVMSRLARARGLLKRRLEGRGGREA
ncbi:MAG: sigma-70 family RNA polymerase sigma factor [Acidobacteriia bacterium]|nr:sigma-70 family RNA polymerase sigma factor [Terriglobia bacterium]